MNQLIDTWIVHVCIHMDNHIELYAARNVEIIIFGTSNRLQNKAVMLPIEHFFNSFYHKKEVGIAQHSTRIIRKKSD